MSGRVLSFARGHRARESIRADNEPASIRISLQNIGGEIDSRTVESTTDAVDAAIEIIEAAGELLPGDRIIITEV